MKKQYKQYWESSKYKISIYVRTDGKRARIDYDRVQWSNSSAARLHRIHKYCIGHDNVRVLCKAIKKKISNQL